LHLGRALRRRRVHSTCAGRCAIGSAVVMNGTPFALNCAPWAGVRRRHVFLRA
jgi:hypothetical protein